MNAEPILSRITIYPIKSLDGIDLDGSVISEGGCLLHDREYAITDAAGKFIIGKTNPLVHALRSEIDFESQRLSFRRQDEPAWKHFQLEREMPAINAYLSDYFGIPASLIQNKTGRFLDVPDISGVTVLSTSSLESISVWYDEMDLNETRKRFRATLEMEGVPAFWEDRLFSGSGKEIEFKIGDVTLFGMSPRARCVVPTRDPETGKVYHAFPKLFTKHRASSLPEWSALEAYGHHYHLSVDCSIPSTEVGKWINLGDRVNIIGERNL
jgi:uncharacterized protein YcbX